MTRFREGLEEARERVEAWWRGERSDRPVLQLTAPRTNAPAYDGPRTDDLDAWWADPAYVLPRLEHELRSTCYAAEAIPVIFPVSTGLVSITNKYLGAPNVYIDRSTTWSSPMIESWGDAPPLDFDHENEWWRRTEHLLHEGVRMIEEQDYQAFVGLPDLNGPTEVLAGLRGAQRFAMDFYDRPEALPPALRRVQDAWFEAYTRSTAIAHRCGGYICWMRTWSELPMIDLQSDVSCLISPGMFNEFFLPLLREQAAAIERTVYHLDGPDAVRHLDALLDIQELDAVQWVPGAGGGRMSEWVDLLKRIQDGGKLVHAACDPDEVLHLTRALDPDRLLLVVQASTQSQAEQIIREAERASRR